MEFEDLRFEEIDDAIKVTFLKNYVFYLKKEDLLPKYAVSEKGRSGFIKHLEALENLIKQQKKL